MSKIIDTSQALEQAAGNEQLAKELFTMLLNELPELEAKLAQAIVENDMQACWDHAHKIYGSTAYCGVPQLRESARNMEESVKIKDKQQIEINFKALQETIQDLLDQGEMALRDSWS